MASERPVAPSAESRCEDAPVDAHVTASAPSTSSAATRTVWHDDPEEKSASAILSELWEGFDAPRMLPPLRTSIEREVLQRVSRLTASSRSTREAAESFQPVLETFTRHRKRRRFRELLNDIDPTKPWTSRGDAVRRLLPLAALEVDFPEEEERARAEHMAYANNKLRAQLTDAERLYGRYYELRDKYDTGKTRPEMALIAELLGSRFEAREFAEIQAFGERYASGACSAAQRRSIAKKIPVFERRYRRASFLANHNGGEESLPAELRSPSVNSGSRAELPETDAGEDGSESEYSSSEADAESLTSASEDEGMEESAGTDRKNANAIPRVRIKPVTAPRAGASDSSASDRESSGVVLSYTSSSDSEGSDDSDYSSS